MNGNENNQDNPGKRSEYISEPDKDGIRYFDVNPGYGYGVGPGAQYNTQLAARKRPMWKNILIFAGILVGILLLAILIPGIGGDQNAIKTPGSDYIANIYVEGTIQSSNTDTWGNAYGYQHEWTMELIDKLGNDEKNRGIIMFVNSPGGTIYESDELYLKIKEYKENTGRPVYSVMGNMAASGGYYISAPCDEIFANRNTWTGSIGVTIGNMFDFSEFLSNHGIKVKTITSGQNKAMGSMYDEMTQEEEAIWRNLIDEAYQQFVGVVAEGRNMDTAYVKGIADGRIYSAAQAKEIGLIDKIGGIDEAYERMLKKIKKDKSTCLLTDMKFVGETNIFTNVFSGFEEITKSSEAAAILNFVDSKGGYPASYLCEALAKQ
ncbi:MAG: signal peptide peptidase SppA [Eubacteriales bacterium]|nr:signal peptide peptidase SppA [Eubacteriales bacterium]